MSTNQNSNIQKQPPEYKREEPLTYKREGTQLIVPEHMSMEDVHKWTGKILKEEEKAVQVLSTIETFPLDGALALTKALKAKFGWASMEPTPGFFGPQPPAMISIEVALGQTVQVPWGRIQMPGVEGYIETGVGQKDGRQVFEISGVVKQKHKFVVEEIAELTRKFVREESIYRGKAVRVTFPEPRKRGEKPDPSDFDPRSHAPRFMDLRGVSESDLVLPENIQRQVETNLFTPVVHTQDARDEGVPLKRGVLLAGPYGVGKTMIANIQAVKATQHGWTFIYLNSVSSLSSALAFAAQYAPAVIFAEDIDQIVGNDERDEKTNLLLNTIDGVETKGQEVMVVLTSNHVERLNPAMLRPGRLDAIITITPPDARAAESLVRKYGRGRIPADESLTRVGEILDGQKPATIREVVERSKLAAISRKVKGQPLTLHARDLETAAEGMVEHIKLMERKPEVQPSAVQLLGREIGEAQARSFFQVIEKVTGSKVLTSGNGRSAGALEAPTA